MRLQGAMATEVKMQPDFKKGGTEKPMKPRTCSFVLLFDLNVGFSVQILGNQYPVLYWEARTVFLCCLVHQHDRGTSAELRGSSSNSPFSLSQS